MSDLRPFHSAIVRHENENFILILRHETLIKLATVLDNDTDALEYWNVCNFKHI